MKEYPLDISTLIGAWYIDSQLCDDLISYHTNNPKLHLQSVNAYGEVDSVMNSVEILVDPNSKDPIFEAYTDSLFTCVSNYIEKFTYMKGLLYPFDIYEPIVLNKYNIGGGFTTTHFENNGSLRTAHRSLVFMTYLNDVPDGGTEFKYQNLTTPAEKGLTLIWPAFYTHPHNGIASTTKEKYVVTGWISHEELFYTSKAFPY